MAFPYGECSLNVHASPATEVVTGFLASIPWEDTNSSAPSREPACPSPQTKLSRAPIPVMVYSSTPQPNAPQHCLTSLLLPRGYACPPPCLGLLPYAATSTCMFFPYFCLYKHQPSLRCGPSETFPIPLHLVAWPCDAEYYRSSSPSPSHMCLGCWGLCAYWGLCATP